MCHWSVLGVVLLALFLSGAISETAGPSQPEEGLLEDDDLQNKPIIIVMLLGSDFPVPGDSGIGLPNAMFKPRQGEENALDSHVLASVGAPAFQKRRFFRNNRNELFKRSSLNELIRRLLAMRGHRFSEGRASMMRFGAGKRK